MLLFALGRATGARIEVEANAPNAAMTCLHIILLHTLTILKNEIGKRLDPRGKAEIFETRRHIRLRFDLTARAGSAVDVIGLFTALLSLRGISTPSLPAQGEQLRCCYFSKDRDIAKRSPCAIRNLRATTRQAPVAPHIAVTCRLAWHAPSVSQTHLNRFVQTIAKITNRIDRVVTEVAAQFLAQLADMAFNHVLFDILVENSVD